MWSIGGLSLYHVIIAATTFCAILLASLNLQNTLPLRTHYSTVVVQQQKTRLPTFTVCKVGDFSPAVKNGNLFNYKENILNLNGYFVQRLYIKIGYIKSWHGLGKAANLTHEHAVQLFNSLTYNLDELVDYVNVTFVTPVEAGHRTLTLSDGAMVKYFKVKMIRQYGRCYMFHPSKGYLEHGIQDITIKSKTNLKLFLSGVDSLKDISSRFKAQVAANSHETLDISYMNINLMQHWREGGQCKDINYDNCHDYAPHEALSKLYGCVPPWVYFEERATEICSNSSILNDVAKYYATFTSNSSSYCPRPCTALMMTISNRHVQRLTDAGAAGYITFKFRHRVLQSNEEYIHSVLSLLAENSGHIELFTGYSWLGLFKALKRLFI